jgi:lysophospholipase L1-like esterase
MTYPRTFRANTQRGLTFFIVTLILAIGITPDGQAGTVTHWVGTWYTAPQLVETGNNPPAPGLANNTLRQIVRISIGGDSLRLRFSNEFSTAAVTFQAVHIALSKGGGSIDTTSDRTLTFGGKGDVTIAPGAAVTSDPLRFPIPARTDIAITTAYGTSPAGITGHPGSRTTSFILPGNVVSKSDAAGAVTTDHWYNIQGIDVLAPLSAASVAILGNSITDGRGSTTNGQNRWPDVMSVSFLQDSATRHVGVLNAGIGGNAVLSGGLGPTGVSRFDRDILGQQGVRWVVVFEGVNDIGAVTNSRAATATAANLIAAYQQFIVKAHANGLKIYGGTIMPFNGNGYYNQYSEQCRNAVNLWIRTTGNFDACIDFDKIMRDPADTTRMLLPAYQNDGLHPDTVGYKLMGGAVDHALFTDASPTGIGGTGDRSSGSFILGQNYPNPFNPSTTIRYSLPGRAHVSLTVYNTLGQLVSVLQNAEQDAGYHETRFFARDLPGGVYFYRMQAGTYMETKRLLLLK